MRRNASAKAAGKWLTTGKGYSAFVPNSLPPELNLNWPLVKLLSEADRAISELSTLASNLPNPHLLINLFIKKEAVLSSKIEGTRASLTDLILFDGDSHNSALSSDVLEVASYVEAMEFARRRLIDLPLSLRLIRETHGVLMGGARAPHLTPGEFRRTQNWIGPPGATLATATYVPPPVDQMLLALNELESFFYTDKGLPPLIKIALIHYQFEAIHPFIDGNGRIGRLLIILFLLNEKMLAHPTLYLSAFFERNRPEYYRRLLAVSKESDWDGWLIFFLTGIKEQSLEAAKSTRDLMRLWESYNHRVEVVRSTGHLTKLINKLFELPIIQISDAAKYLGVTNRAAQMNVQKLIDAKILTEITGKSRNRKFAANEIFSILAHNSQPA